MIKCGLKIHQKQPIFFFYLSFLDSTMLYILMKNTCFLIRPSETYMTTGKVIFVLINFLKNGHCSIPNPMKTLVISSKS